MSHFSYRTWTLQKQIITITSIALSVVLLTLIIFLGLGLSNLYEQGESGLIKELERVEEDNLGDLGSQIQLNYQIFREYISKKSLNLAHDVIAESMYGTRLLTLDSSQRKVYLLNHENLGINTFQDIADNYPDKTKTTWTDSELINKETN